MKDVVDLKAKRFQRDFLQYLGLKRALTNDLLDLIVLKHPDCDQDMVLRAFAEVMVKIGVATKTNGQSLLKCLGGEIEAYIDIPADSIADDARFVEWFKAGIPPEWLEMTSLEIYKE
jgi:hypothetical protein